MRTRVLLGVILVCSYAGYASFDLLKLERGAFRAGGAWSGKDEITRYEGRFDGIRKMLPAFGTVAYVNDVKDLNENRAAWSLTQYALAPLFIVDSLEPGRVESPWVVGNFHYKVPDAVATEKLILVRNFGNGVFLFTRNAR